MDTGSDVGSGAERTTTPRFGFQAHQVFWSETGVIAFFTTMHLAKRASDVANAYKYLDTAISKEVQERLMQPPYFLAPVNSDVALDSSLPLKSLDEMSKFVRHDWSKINPLRAGWIERFNKEVAK